MATPAPTSQSRRRARGPLAAGALLLALVASPAGAQTPYVEDGDASHVVAEAQDTGYAVDAFGAPFTVALEGRFAAPDDVDVYRLAATDTTGVVRIRAFWPEHPSRLDAYQLRGFAGDGRREVIHFGAGDSRPTIVLPVTPGVDWALAVAHGRDNPEEVFTIESPLAVTSTSTRFMNNVSGRYRLHTVGHFVGTPRVLELPARTADPADNGEPVCVSDAEDLGGTLDVLDAVRFEADVDEAGHLVRRVSLRGQDGEPLDLDRLGFQVRGNTANQVYVFRASDGEVIGRYGFDQDDPMASDPPGRVEVNFQGDHNPGLAPGEPATWDLRGEDEVVVMVGVVVETTGAPPSCIAAADSRWYVREGATYVLPVYPLPGALDIVSNTSRADGLALGFRLDGPTNQCDAWEVTATTPSGYAATDTLRVAWATGAGESQDVGLTLPPAVGRDGEELTVAATPLCRSLYYERQPRPGDAVTLTAPTPVAAEDGPARPGLALAAARPNPAAGSVRVTVAAARPGAVDLALVDVLGRELVRVRRHAGPGRTDVDVDLRGVAPGVYRLVATGGGARASVPVTVTR